MPSLVPGFAYDLFISYRQNDNRSGWVTEFVRALQEELSATIKEPVSVYFDSNPHDGLLETHDVDGSLKDKVKCLVFIPIVSQTYCDASAFAWQKEFLPFLDLARADQFGLDIRLSNGNVAKRVLPIRIHEIDAGDKKLFEEAIDAVMRSMDFVFSSPGVNRPLTPLDKREENTNKTFYRDQVNRTANAIKQIIESMRGKGEAHARVPPPVRRVSEIHRFTRVGLWVTAVSLLLLIGWFVFLPKSAYESKSVAVLPIENLTGDPDQDFFVNGFQEALIGALGQVSALRVISRTSTLRYRQSDKLLPEIARELGVDHILEGSVHGSGDRKVIQLRLVAAFPEEKHLWEEEYDQDLQKMTALEGDMVHTIAQQIQVSLTPGEESRLFHSGSTNPEAYKAYLKGLYYWDRLTRDDLDKAMGFFEEALTLDPQFALAHAGISMVWLGRLQQGYTSYAEASSKMKGPVLRAVELDSTLSDVHAILGGIFCWGEWNYTQAEKEYRKAIALNPNNSFAHAYLSHVLNILHKREEAMGHIQMALTLDPYNPLYRAIYGMDLNFVRQFDLAIEELGSALKTSPTDAIALSTLRTSYHMKGLHDDALGIWKRSYQAKDDQAAIDALTSGEKTGGYPGALENLARLMIARSDTSYVTPFQIATLFTRAGNETEAIDWLEKAYYAHDNNMPYIGIDPIFEILHDNERYRSLVKKMGLELP